MEGDPWLVGGWLRWRNSFNTSGDYDRPLMDIHLQYLLSKGKLKEGKRNLKKKKRKNKEKGKFRLFFFY